MATQTEILKKIREQDEQKEVQKSPENESLHPARIQRYLEENDYTAKNFNDKFNFNTALEILRVKQTPGEVHLEREMVAAKEYLDKIGLNGEELLSDGSAATFTSTIHKELMTRNALDQEKMLVQAHAKYLLIRNLAYRRLQIQEQFAEVREEEKVGATGSLKEGFNKVVSDVKENFSKMSKGEKAVAVGALVIGTIWLFSQSDNPKVQKIKDYAWKGLKIAGAGVGFNYVYKLFTGKTALDAFGDYTKKTAGSKGFWKETYKTTEENAEILQKSTLYLGDRDFMDLAKQYRDARGSKSKEIRLVTVPESDMSPKEIYTALDTFFKRYPVDAMEKKYKNWPPESRKWSTVISTEMAEDGRFEVEGNVAERAYDTLREGAHRGYNWLVADGFGVSAYLYKKIHGKEGSEAEVKDWVKKYFKNVVESNSALKKYTEESFRYKSAQNYKEVIDRGQIHKEGVKFLEAAGDSLYVVSDVKIDNLAANEKAIGDAIKLAETQITDFLKERFPKHKENIYKFTVFEGGACVVEDSTFRLFARMPLPGTADYHALNSGEKTTEDLAERKDIEAFETEISYKGLPAWQQEQLRIRFLLDSSQEHELQQICDWFTKKYKPLGVPIKTVYENLLTNDEDREAALKATKVKQELVKNSQLLEHEMEERVTDIEKDAAADAPKEMFDELIDQMRISWGYKVRLAILGDTAARDRMEFHKATGDKVEKMLKQYEKLCEDYVKERLQGGA